MTKNDMLENLLIGLQKKSDEEIIKRECFLDGIEAFLYVDVTGLIGERGIAKLRKEALMESDENIKKVWERALENTRKRTRIQKLSEILGVESDEIFPLYVMTNEDAFHGASAVLDRETLQRFGEEHQVKKIVVLPSSIHEVLLIPFDESLDMKELSEMVSSVNESDVLPCDRLADRAFLIELS